VEVVEQRGGGRVKKRVGFQPKKTCYHSSFYTKHAIVLFFVLFFVLFLVSSSASERVMILPEMTTVVEGAWRRWCVPSS
jgi:hypothetical protein